MRSPVWGGSATRPSTPVLEYLVVPPSAPVIDRYLEAYVPKFDRALERFLRGRGRAAARIAPEVRAGAQELGRYLRGGKKLRAALVQIGYECAGGRRSLWSAALAYEALHGFLLAHDDIMDRADIRRGRPTLHRRYEEILRRRARATDGAHRGIAVALNLGDLACFWALELLAITPAPAAAHRRVLREIGAILAETAAGQLLDLLVDWRSPRAIYRVRQIAARKTARYSVVGPLVVGALFAGAPRPLVHALRSFGVPVGIAFQLRDDLLGLYGAEAEIGKDPLSDLWEGKPSALIIRAYRRAAAPERRILERLWGNRACGERDRRTVQDIVEETGTRRAVEDEAERLVRRGVRALRQARLPGGRQELLASFAEYAARRRR